MSEYQDVSAQQEVLSPSDAEKFRIQREIAMTRESYVAQDRKRWNALIHVIVIMGVISLMGLGVTVMATQFGVYEMMVGAGFAIAASIAAYCYIQFSTTTHIKSR